MAKPIVNLYKLGRLPYVKGLNIQQLLFERLKAKVITTTQTSGINNNNSNNSNKKTELGIDSSQQLADTHNSLILVEHEPVYTIGLRNNQYDRVYEEKLRQELDKHELKADFFRTNRGGLITFHGPGQLVAYPILYLGDFNRIKNRSIKAYVNSLEATIIDTLARIGLNGAHTIQEYPGVWLDDGQRKIAFLGIACKRYVTMHGISINCNCDLKWFNHIVSCGIEDRAITSIHQEMISKSSNHHRHQFKKEQGDGGNLSTSPSSSSSSLSSRTNSSILNNPHLKQQQLSDPLRSLDVGQVSKTFCESFSQIFDCNLLEKQKHELDHEIIGLMI